MAKLKIIYSRGIGPTYELYSSSRRTAVVPLLKNYMQFFLVIFLGWIMLPHPKATSTDHGGPRTSDLSIETLKERLKIRNSQRTLINSGNSDKKKVLDSVIAFQ